MTDYLKGINSPDDLKKLPIEALPDLAGEIREELLSILSQVGGHLGGNLGVVELSIALHYVYDSPTDRLVWDTGHQSYVHKILTGRLDQMLTIRQYGGLSGFAKTTESEHDIYGAGHASTSISAAFGMAASRDLSNLTHQVVAIIGDGAMTGGLAFEALNNLGRSGRDMLVILNDNSMSIDKNVGALSEYLTELLTDQTYNKIKDHIWGLTGKIRKGSRIREVVGRIDEAVKGVLVPGVMFEKLGFRYFGPIDGHDAVGLVKTLSQIKNLHGPIFLHIRTQKGKGYKPAEEDACRLHGVNKFDKVTGKSEKAAGIAYTKVFSKTMVELGQEYPEMVAITAAMPTGTGLTDFAREFPERFFDVGIAEQHGGVFAAGLSRDGKKPVFAVYSTFLQRAYDAVIHDIALQKFPVLLGLDRAGLAGNDGPTHHGAFDISYLRPVPGLVMIAPKDGTELRQSLHLAMKNFNAPMAIRWPRADIPEGELQLDRPMFEWGTWELVRKGKDAAFLAVGTMVDQSLRSAELLAARGLEVAVYNCRFIKPFDETMLTEITNRFTNLITIEEGALIGGFGSGINDWIADKGRNQIKLLRLGLPDNFIEHGSRDQLLKLLSLHPEGVVRSVEKLLGVRSPVDATAGDSTSATNRVASIKIAAKGKL
ncbi:MAG: 1-deoxy-D-xylulose-5-phosphate synthase [Candidatus Zixiibacteriota bacterium]